MTRLRESQAKAEVAAVEEARRAERELLAATATAQAKEVEEMQEALREAQEELAALRTSLPLHVQQSQAPRASSQMRPLQAQQSQGELLGSILDIDTPPQQTPALGATPLPNTPDAGIRNQAAASDMAHAVGASPASEALAPRSGGPRSAEPSRSADASDVADREVEVDDGEFLLGGVDIMPVEGTPVRDGTGEDDGDTKVAALFQLATENSMLKAEVAQLQRSIAHSQAGVRLLPPRVPTQLCSSGRCTILLVRAKHNCTRLGLASNNCPYDRSLFRPLCAWPPHRR